MFSINIFIFYFEWLALEEQYEFREYLLTELAHIELGVRLIKALDDKNINIYECRGSAPHPEIWNFLYKLQYYGMLGVTLDWFSRYVIFNNQHSVARTRSQCIIIQKIYHDPCTSGVKFGPLIIFNLYKDLPNATKVFEFTSFASYTDLFSTFKYSMPINRTNVNETLNNELLKVHGWLMIN